VCLLPLSAGAALLLMGDRLGRAAAWVVLAAMAGALGIAGWVAIQSWGLPPLLSDWRWFQIGSLTFSAGIRLDSLSRLLLVLVPFVALPVMGFAARYLQGEARYTTFFGLLSLFLAAMLGLILARNFLALTLCWEVVGFTSYLLIGFWFTKPEAALAARHAFLLNRLGDLGLFTAMGALLAVSGSLDLVPSGQTLAAMQAQHPALMTLVGAGLMVAAIAKSAQFPLTPWLPRAMEGPTPVSALLHAATLVAAGAYLLARTNTLLSPAVLTGLAAVGALTVVWGAVAALGQTDLKRVLAYSTASQLGYVFLAIGTGHPTAAVLHLVAHAFFKASLFLNAGIVTHAAGHAATASFDPQDLRQLGGLRRALPGTFSAYCLAGSALVGLPLTTGFLTKEAILTGAFSWANTAGGWAWAVPAAGLMGVALTALYVARHGRLIFLGATRGPLDPAHIRESPTRETPLALLAPVVGLALLAVWVWLSLSPLHLTSPLFSEGPEAADTGHWAWLPLISVALVASGLTAGLRGLGPAEGWWWTRTGEAALGRFWTELGPRAAFNVAHALARFDEVGLDRQVLRFGKGIVIGAKLTGWFDRWVVDLGVVHGVGRGLTMLGRTVRLAQGTGVQTYYRWAVALGLAAVGWLAWG
jgi:NADH-quinone oxidoreductase subunit L